MTTISYPPSMRGTGTGWGYAIAKIGAMAAPIVGGVTLSWNWSAGRICTDDALASLLAAVVGAILGGRALAAAARKKRKVALNAMA